MQKEQEKWLIVEGKTDKQKVKSLLDEPVRIVCTHGTVGIEQMDELINVLENREVYVLVDADDAGNKLRKQLKQELPNAKHLYIRKMHKEVARTPDDELLRILENAHFQVRAGSLPFQNGRTER